MADKTDIAWTDSTFNSWWGCSRVSPGCEHCYAEALDTRTGGDHWGPRKTPRVMSEENWRKPGRWNKEHGAFFTEHGRRRRVFCGSMCDWADKLAPQGQRDRLWHLIQTTPNLDWMLLTKRAPNIVKYLPEDWDGGYANVSLGVTVDDRRHGLPRIDILRKIPAKMRFISIEPLLEDLGHVDLSGIDLVIVGGESGPQARPMHPAWVRSLREQCEQTGVSFFFKQWGEWQPISPVDWNGVSRRIGLSRSGHVYEGDSLDQVLRSWKGHEVEGNISCLQKIGKARAGHKLDGQVIQQWPLIVRGVPSPSLAGQAPIVTSAHCVGDHNMTRMDQTLINLNGLSL